jgi:hypothetical protein
MAGSLRVVLEVGPKGKKVAAVAPDWPGLERGAATEDAALEKLLEYMPRYQKVARSAGAGAKFVPVENVNVIERYTGTGSTDFWGISFAFSNIDRRTMTNEELERELGLLQGCWSFFDVVRTRVSSEMRKGPRGGGRDRDRIVEHVLANEQEWAAKVGVPISDLDIAHDVKELRAHRRAMCAAIRQCHAEGRAARNWPLRYLIRHAAFHAMDHAWEMEDKDLTIRGGTR